MGNVTVFRESSGGQTRARWDFVAEGSDMQAGWAVRLVGYSIERRTPGGRSWRAVWPAQRWTISDERSYVSGLPRPTEIPRDVLDEAIANARELPLTVYIGFRNAKCRYEPS